MASSVRSGSPSAGPTSWSFASVRLASLESVLHRWRISNVPIPEMHLAAVLGALAMDIAAGRPLHAKRPARRSAGAATAALASRSLRGRW